jgi:pimeloyl-ACP methyl ester carboxylesterase
MGGLIGMGLASLPDSPIRKLVLNDVGPVLKGEALKRIGEYLGKAPEFPDFATAEQYIRDVSASFGLTTDAQWKFLTEVSLKPTEGGFKMHYDPAIAVPLQQQRVGSADIELWPVYEAIKCRVLVTRGEHSDLLSRETLAQMAVRGPKASAVEIPGVGHAPMFMDAGQIEVVRKFLLD